jgi:hypothetical protein
MLFATARLHHQHAVRRRSALLKIGSSKDASSGSRINDTTLFTAARCGVAELVEPFGRILILSTGEGVPDKQIAERHLVGDLWFVCAIADLVRFFKAEPRVRASRQMSF